MCDVCRREASFVPARSTRKGRERKKIRFDVFDSLLMLYYALSGE